MDIQKTIQAQNAFFQTNKTKDIEFRVNALKTLRQGIIRHEANILTALKLDLNKAPMEAIMTEIGIVTSELDHILKHIRHWAKPKKVKTPFMLIAASSKVIYEPYGVVLIMSPWNYPFQLAIDPLIGAIAAGNCAVVKPASYAKHTSDAIKLMLDECFPPEYVTTILGGREENTQLLEQKFDYIFFTGSTAVGKTVMEKASRFLTPVSLELGGKSPCIIDGTMDLKLTAKRLAFGKFINAGQTCVAPDYVFVKKEYKTALIDALKTVITEFFGADPVHNPDFPKIINNKHLWRLIDLMKDQSIALGGNYTETSIAPTVLDEVSLEDPIMQEEIFGPILPIMAYEDIAEVILYVKSKPRPLALYLFSTDKKMQNRIFSEISFGGATLNDTIMHVASSELAFGGVGDSGMGSYHGIHSFTTFSHAKSILQRKNWLDLDFRYHPYSKSKQRLIEIFTKK